MNRGFGLVELLIAITLAGVIGTVLVTLLVQNQGLFIRQSTKVSQGINLNDTQAEISNSIKVSSGIVSTNPIGTPQFTTGSDIIVLSLPAIDSQGQKIEQVFDYIIILQDSSTSTVKKKLFASASSSRPAEDKVLARGVQLLQFVYKDQIGNIVSATSASKVNFTITLLDTSGYGQQQTALSGEVTLRNN